MDWTETHIALNYVLAELYPFHQDSVRIVTAAGIPTHLVNWQPKTIDNWFNIILEATKHNKVSNLVQAALKDYPDNPILIQASKGELVNSSAAPKIDDKNTPWRATLQPDNFEKITGKQSTLLPISFLEIGLQRARSVARVCLATGEIGTGFLLPDNIFVTNHHVIKNTEQAQSAVVQFNYQKSSTGLDVAPVELHFAPAEGFITSKEHDYTLIKMSEDANKNWGAIEIELIDVSKIQYVNIIQHPSGGPKHIALYHNIVAYSDENVIQYLTDTLPGSSGSPVFDDLWRVVALHHSGGYITEPNTKNTVFRNEGININKIVEALSQAQFS
jgi:V8-like Glu-specific endopeptidase